MSIRYIVGNPGSGKSYYGVKVLYDAFLRPKKPNIFSFLGAAYKNYKKGEHEKTLNEILKENDKSEKEFLVAYTNINEFKFELSDKIKKLDFEDLLIKLNTLYFEYKHNKDSGDKELIELAKELELYKALFVIDEIHNFFDKDNEVLQWWLTYHRHLYQELYLITQDLSLVATQYKSIAEFFYKAVDSSKRFFSKKFRYIQYSSYKLYQKDVIKKFHVDFEKEIFDLYHSGNNGLGKSAVKKFLFIAGSLALLVFLMLKLFVGLFLTSDEKPKNVNKTQKVDTNVTRKIENKKDLKQVANNSVKESFYYKYTCNLTYCLFENSSVYFNKEVIDYLKGTTEILHESKKTHVKGFITHTLIIKDDVFKPLNIKFNDEGKTDEKNTSSGFGLPGFGSKP